MATRSERVIITGASSGIGRDVAARFLSEGASIVINARDPERLSRVRDELGEEARVIAVAGEIGDPRTGPRLAEAAVRHFGGVDVLVNSAGLFGAKPFLESTEADLDAFYATNVKGTYLVTQAAVRAMIAGGQGGAVVTIGAVIVEHPMRGVPTSAAMTSKGALHALTYNLASELAAQRIRVNAVAPGIIRTPLIGASADELGARSPFGHAGDVRDTSDAILYLARAPYVSGMILPVDGGYTHAR
jgi:NAD(P)-dependent dehydrogenase (short-subunit alcohol dehydrogenase family)